MISLSSADNALHLLMVFFAFACMFGGKKGAQWAWRMITAPLRMLLSGLNAGLQHQITVLVIIVLSGFGIFTLFHRIFSALVMHPLSRH